MQNFGLIDRSIITFIRDNVKSNNFKGVVLGISGGIDSAVTAYCATNSLGSEEVLGLLLPDKDITPQQDIDDAKKICKLLKINYKLIYINDIKEKFLQVVENTGNKLVIGNVVARIRMNILYYHANLLNRLVIGTTNKTEVSIGYFTKYGDGASDLAPLADLYKTQVKDYARYLNLPNEIINKKSSARLWENQHTEDEIGLSFEELDAILMHINKLDLSDELTLSSLQKKFPFTSKEKICNIIYLVKKNKHKLMVSSICHFD